MLNTFSCSGGGLEPHKIDGSYRSVLKLAIQRVTSSDYGTYKCVSKNSLGDTEGTIKLYRKYFFSNYLLLFLEKRIIEVKLLCSHVAVTRCLFLLVFMSAYSESIPQK